MIELRRQQMGIQAVPKSPAYPTKPNNAQARPKGMVMGNMGPNVKVNGVGTSYRSVPGQGQVPTFKQNTQNASPTPLAIVTAQDKNLESFLNLLSYSSSNITPKTPTESITTSGVTTAATDSTPNPVKPSIPQQDKISTIHPTPPTKSSSIPKKLPKSLPPPSAPTVPTSLTRRILQTQGCSFLDPNIATVMSHAADHFLATVLSKALACRDLRIQGEDLRKQVYDMEKLERRKRKQAWEDRMESKRKKMLIKEGKWKEDIEKARKLKEEHERMMMDGNGSLGGNSASGRAGKNKGSNSKRKSSGSSSKKKNQSKQENSETAPNGKGANDKTQEVEEDDISLDSLEAGDLDDDAFYYEDDLDLSSDEDNEDDDEDDENRDILLLKDLERPIQAWGMTFAGKFNLTSNDFFTELHARDTMTHPGDAERGGEKGGDGKSENLSSGEGQPSIKNDGKSLTTSSSSKSKTGNDGPGKKSIDTKSSSSGSSKKPVDK